MFWLLGLSIVFAALNSVVLHKAKINGGRAIYKYNLLCAAVWCLCLFAANGCKIRFTSDVLLWGGIYGLTQTLFILFKTLAMNRGSVSLTTLMGNCSLLISVLVCFFVWDEGISAADIVGLALLMGGMVLTTYQRGGKERSKSWLVYALLFLLCSAGVGITFKAFSKTGNADHAGDMMFVSAAVMLINYSLILLVTLSRRSDKNKIKLESGTEKKERIAFVVYALVSGVLSCLYNRFNVYLSSVLDGVIFFPVFNGGVVVLSTLLSILIFREKLHWKQLTGILINVTGICIIGIL